MSKKNRTENRFRGVIMPTRSHPAIRAVTRRGAHPSSLGDKLLNSFCLVMYYLHNHRRHDCAKVIDVGCGWGLSGFWCS